MSESTVEIRVLGEPELAVDGVRLTFPAGRPGRLLAAVALARGRVVTADRLVDEVWGDDVPADARAALHTTVGRARRALGPRGSCLQRRPAGYRLSDTVVDGDLFLAEVAGLTDRPADEVVRRADELSARWRGPAWGGLADLAAGEALRLEEARLVVRERRAAALLDLGRTAEAVGDLQVLVAEEPLREQAVGLLMSGLHRSGDVAGALAAYAAHRELLAEELGLDPAPRLVELHGEVLRREGGVEPQPLAGSEPGAGEELIGREAQLTAVAQLLDRHRCLTVVGPGGVGKTALLARSVRGRPHWWVDLTIAVRSSDVARVVAEAVGAETYPGSTATQALAARLRTLPGVLVLDNCEHVLEGAAEVAEIALGAGPDVRVLASSRERLGASGEAVLPLPPLRLPGHGDTDSPAVDLFIVRARAVAPDLPDDLETRATVAEVVRRLDGLPLAIELAAHRAGSITLEDLRDHLGDRLDLLRSRSPRSPHRQRTLASTVAWSYELLDEPTRAGFRRLSVFPRAFDLAGAARVLGPEAPVLVADLVERSLVLRPEGHAHGRYRMLETVRTCARELLGGAEAVEAEARHAAWVADEVDRAAEGLRGTEEGRWGVLLDELLPDARAATHRMLASGDAAVAGRIVGGLRWWAYLRLRSDVAAWAIDVLAADPDASAEVHLAGATHYWLEGDPAAATRLGRRALEKAVPGSATATAALDALSDAALAVGDFAEADRLSRRGEAGAEEDGRWFDVALSVSARALATTYGGRPADELVARAQAAAARSGNPTAIALADFSEGEALASSDPRRALEALARSSAIATGVGDRLIAGVARTVELAVLARTAEVDEALLARCAGAVETWLATGNENLFLTCLRNLAPLLARIGADDDLVALLAATDPEDVEPAPGQPALLAAARERLGGAAYDRARAAGSVRTTEDAGRELVRVLRART